MSDTENTSQESIWPKNAPLPEGVEATEFVVNTLLTQTDIQERFGFHKDSEANKYLQLAFMQFADDLNNRLGMSRAAALAQTALEEASMWSHKAITVNDPVDPEA